MSDDNLQALHVMKLAGALLFRAVAQLVVEATLPFTLAVLLTGSIGAIERLPCRAALLLLETPRSLFRTMT